MSAVEPLRSAALGDGGRSEPAFGQGGDDPYRSHLSSTSPGRLVLHRVGGHAHPPHEGLVPLGPPTGTGWRLEVLTAAADPADLHAIDGVQGPLLDVGCGPGRMVEAAGAGGLSALGLDVAREAASATRARGAQVLLGSVFDPVPGEGGWQTVLLMDGNLGIGGDPAALLARCAELLLPGGCLVVEADAADDADERGWYVVVDETGGRSEPFPWARLGHDALVTAVRRAGLVPQESRASRGRRFVHAVRPA